MEAKDFFKTISAEQIGNAKRIKSNSFNALPEKELYIIDMSGIGINYAYKKDKIIYVYTTRVYGSDYASYSEEEFNQWRKKCEEF